MKFKIAATQKPLKCVMRLWGPGLRGAVRCVKIFLKRRYTFESKFGCKVLLINLKIYVIDMMVISCIPPPLFCESLKDRQQKETKYTPSDSISISSLCIYFTSFISLHYNTL